jgi:small Trp-rich protein
MVLLLIGLLLVAFKLLGIGPLATWPWWTLLIPFGLAVAWWSLSDAMGLTQRAAARRDEERKAARRAKALAELHQAPGSSRSPKGRRPARGKS